MKNRYFLHLAYNGFKFHGWQRQSKVRSVQEVIETHLSKILKEEIKCHGCGRTDAQVHASQYFLHFLSEKEVDFDLVFRLNKVLPDAIAVYDLIPFQIRANAQRDAQKRTYDYLLHQNKNPYLAEFSNWQDLGQLNQNALSDGINFLRTVTDFRSLCISPDQYKSTECKIFQLNLYRTPDSDRMRLQITANRFLRKMIRLIVARLLDLGTGKMKVSDFEAAVIAGDKPVFTRAAHPQGLFLSKVTYPFLDLPARSNPLLDHEEWVLV